MTIYVFAGESTKKVVAALSKNPDITVTGTPTVSAWLSQLESTGFQANKYVIHSSAVTIPKQQFAMQLNQIVQRIPAQSEIIFLDYAKSYQSTIEYLAIQESKLKYFSEIDTFPKMWNAIFGKTAPHMNDRIIKRVKKPTVPDTDKAVTPTIINSDADAVVEPTIDEEVVQPTIEGVEQPENNETTESPKPATNKQAQPKVVKQVATPKVVQNPSIPVQQSGTMKHGLASMKFNNAVNTRFGVTEKDIQELRKRSRLIVVTGDNRSGVSGITANLAMSASYLGIRTLVVDLDLMRRAQSVYLPAHINLEDTKLLYSLLNATRASYQISDYAIKINSNLSRIGIDLSVQNDNLNKDLLNSDAINRMLINARAQYGLVLIDLPYTFWKTFSSALANANVIAFVQTAELISLLNTANLVEDSSFADTNDFNTFTSKMVFLCNQVTTQNVKEYPQKLSEMSDNPIFEGLDIVGKIGVIANYAQQVDDGVLLVEDNNNTALLTKFVTILRDLYRY